MEGREQRSIVNILFQELYFLKMELKMLHIKILIFQDKSNKKVVRDLFFD